MITTWILILLVQRSEYAITNIPGFDTKTSCQLAGKTAEDEFQLKYAGTVRYACVRQDK